MNERIEFAKGVLKRAIKDMKKSGDTWVHWQLKLEDAQAVLYALERMEPCTTKGKVVSDDPKSRSPFHATVEGMLSPDYKERFKAEYAQTKIRYEKLKAFNNIIEAAYGSENVEMPLQDCPPELLRKQQAAMGEYLHILEVRAVIEGIDL